MKSMMSKTNRIAKRSVFIPCLLAGICLASVSTAEAAGNAVNGKALYDTTKSAPLTCQSSQCHGADPLDNIKGTQRGANNGFVIMQAIAHVPDMTFLSSFISAPEADDLGAYIANPSAANTFPVNLVANWNLLGNGSDAALDIAATLNDNAKVTTVWKWVPATRRWAFYTPSMTASALADYAASKGYDVLSTINGGEGFWVNAKQPFTVQMPAGSALLASGFQARLMAGWNLISLGENKTPSQFNIALSPTQPAPGIVPTNLTSLWAWDASLAGWYFYAPNLEANGGLADYVAAKGYLDFTAHGKMLGQGAGFWVNKP